MLLPPSDHSPDVSGPRSPGEAHAAPGNAATALPAISSTPPLMATAAAAESLDQSELPVLQTEGFGATVDAFAWEEEKDATSPRMRLWFLSLLGPQQAVKALWARLVRGEVATMRFPAP